MKRIWSIGIGLWCCWCALGAARVGQPAPDFPPGLFTDGAARSLKDFEGKAVVLFFYDQECPKCRAGIAERNKVVESYRDKPVKFIAIAAGDSLADARAYATATKLNMSVFADNLSLMERRYGAGISLKNAIQVRVIGPDGNFAASATDLLPEVLDPVIEKAAWTFRAQGYDSRLDAVVELFETGKLAEGLKLLKPLMGSTRKETAESARKLADAGKEQGAKWLAQADALQAEKPVDAYDLYARLMAAFPQDDLGRKAGEGVKRLSKDASVKDELAARPLWQKLCAGAARAAVKDRPELLEYAAEIARKYSKTPTGAKAQELTKELMGG